MLKTAGSRLNAMQVGLLKDLGRDVSVLGVNLMVYDPEINLLFNFDGGRFISDYESAAACAKFVLDSPSDSIQTFGKLEQILCVNLLVENRTDVVIVLDCGQSMPSAADKGESVSKYMQQILKMFTDAFGRCTKVSSR